MANYRRGRINDETARVAAELLRGVKDPRVAEAFISVTAAEVSPDLKYAKIYYSVLGGEHDAEKMKRISQGLRSASGYVRRGLAEKMNLRITPEVHFVPDMGAANGAHIATLLEDITKKSAEHKPENPGASEPHDDN